VSPSERISLDGYVIDALMPDLVGHDRRASAFIVYLFLWRRTRGAARPAVVSHHIIASGTGLAKRSVQTALRVLESRRLVAIKRRSATSAQTIELRCHWRPAERLGTPIR
jgi:hypothetical protein